MAATRKSGTRTAKSAATKGAGKARGGAVRDRPKRAGDGRFKPDHHVRNAAVGATAFLATAAAGLAAAFRFGLLDRFLPASEGHSAEDLLIEDHPGPDHRAPAAFRPDIDAPMSKAEREALRPPKGKPGITASEGEIAGT